MNESLSHSHWIGKFTDKELTPGEETRLLSQASHNPLLRNELRLDMDINELFDDYDRIQLSETIRKTIRKERGRIIIPAYLKIAASVIILLALSTLTGLIFTFLEHNFQPPELSGNPFLNSQSRGLLCFLPGHSRPSLPSTPLKRRELAQITMSNNPYTPRPEYEFLVGTVTRDISLFVISPLPRVKCRSDSQLKFSWKWLRGPVPVSLEITDNHGRIVLNQVQMTDDSYVLNTRHWARGLYYYKISAGDELVTVGSISMY